MDCSLARESLSAWADREEAPAQPLDVAQHLAGCGECTAYAEQLRGLGELTGALQRATASAPAPRAAGPTTSGGVRWMRGLRLALVALSLVELAAAFAELASEHGYAGEDHAGHESLSFTLAVCAGLLWIAWRPAYARSYLPLVGVAATLLVATATVDVVSGRAEVLDELPHLGFLVGFGLLWLLCHGGGRWGAATPPPEPGVAPPARRPRLRVVRASLRAAAVATVPAVVLVAGPALGHATLEASTPGQDALVRSLPARVMVRFDEPVTTLPTSLEVYGPDGSRIDDGAVTHPGGNGAEVSVGTTGSRRGTYLVSWRVISADSHPVSGAFTFSVGTRTAAPIAPADQSDRLLGVLLGGSRWLGYAGSALALGGLLFLVACWPAGRDRAGPRRLVLGGMGLLVAGAALSVLLKGPDDAALGLSAVGRGSLLHEVLASTYGHAQVARAALAVVLAALVGRGAELVRPWRLAGFAVVGLGLLATYAASGHAVTDGPRWVSFPLDMAHVGAMSAWLGGLVVLVGFVLREGPENAAAAGAARRFSRVALAAVGVLVVTGGYQAWRQVRSWGALTATTYGHELLVKLGLVALILVVAAASRRWVRRRGTDLSVLRRRVGLETGGIAVVLGLTSALVATAPARSAYHPSVAADLRLGPDLVQVSAIPAGDRQMQVHLYLFDRRQRPTEPRQISASVSLPSAQIGPLPVRLDKVGRGHRIADLAVPVAGDWSMAVDVRTSAIDEYTKSVTLPIR